MARATSSISLATRCSGRAVAPAMDPGGAREQRPRVEDDNIVTRFCEVVTPRDSPANLRSARLATNEMGEAMAPASDPPPAGSGAGAAPLFSSAIAAALVA